MRKQITYYQKNFLIVQMLYLLYKIYIMRVFYYWIRKIIIKYITNYLQIKNNKQIFLTLVIFRQLKAIGNYKTISMNLAILFERSEFRALQIWFYNGQRKIGIGRQSSFVTFLAHERKVSIGYSNSFSLVVKKTNQKKPPAHALFTLSKIKICRQRSKLAKLKQQN